MHKQLHTYNCLDASSNDNSQGVHIFDIYAPQRPQLCAANSQWGGGSYDSVVNNNKQQPYKTNITINNNNNNKNNNQ